MSTETSTETVLRERLARIAERTAPPEDPGLATRVAARSRAGHRQRVGLTALAAAVAAVVVAVPVALSGPAAEPAPGPASPASTASVFAGPTRGPLAGDAAFVEGVRQLPWQLPEQGLTGPEPDVSTRRVVWAGDVPGRRWALVVGENTARPEGAAADPAVQTDLGALSDVAMAWFAGPPGAGPAQMELATVPRGVDPAQPVGLADNTTGALVVVALRGDSIDVSRRPEVGADAAVTRTWEPADVSEGVAVVALPDDGTARPPALRFRVTREGREVVTGSPETTVTSGPTAVATVEWLRPGSYALMADAMAHGLLDLFGLPGDDVRFVLAWLGFVPAPGDRSADVTVLTATLPSGAVYVQANLMVNRPDGSGAGAACGTELRPAGPPVAEQTFVVRCDVTDLGPDPEVLPTLVVVAPPAATVARALDAGGGELGSVALEAGVAVASFPEGTVTVRTETADGAVLDERAPMGTVDWGE
ncbi:MULTISPECIES: hypothetical protein [unclassified Blastococcus]